MRAVDNIAGKLIKAAYQRFGRPPEAAGIYIKEVTRDHDVPAFFRKMAKLADARRSKALRKKFMALFDQDAFMVMEAGLDQMLKDDALPARQRRIAEEIKALELWVIAERDRETAEWQDALMAEIECENALAAKLAPAAREYIGKSLPELAPLMEGTTVADYFRKMVDLAKCPRTLRVWRQYQTEIYEHEPEFVMEAGMHVLADDAALPEGERRLIELVTEFDYWATKMAYKLTQ